MEELDKGKKLDTIRWLNENIGSTSSGYNDKLIRLINYEHKYYLNDDAVLNDFFKEKKLKLLKFENNDKNYDENYRTLVLNLIMIVYNDEDKDREIILDLIKRTNIDYDSAYEILKNEKSYIKGKEGIINTYNINSATDLTMLEKNQLLDIAETLKIAKKNGFKKFLYIKQTAGSLKNRKSRKYNAKKLRKTKSRKNH